MRLSFSKKFKIAEKFISDSVVTIKGSLIEESTFKKLKNFFKLCSSKYRIVKDLSTDFAPLITLSFSNFSWSLSFPFPYLQKKLAWKRKEG